MLGCFREEEQLLLLFFYTPEKVCPKSDKVRLKINLTLFQNIITSMFVCCIFYQEQLPKQLLDI